MEKEQETPVRETLPLDVLQDEIDLLRGSRGQNTDGSGRMGYIYRISCLVTEMSYIGKCTSTVNDRFNAHCSQKVWSLIDKEIQRLGRDCFTVETIQTCPIDTLDAYEAWAISSYNTLTPNGYNVQKYTRGHEASSLSAYFLSLTESVDVVPIKNGGQNRLVRVLLTLFEQGRERQRLMFGQGKDDTFENAVLQAKEFVKPFAEVGKKVRYHPDILGVADPLATYYVKINQFDGRDIVKLRLTTVNDKSRGFMRVTLNVRLKEHKIWRDEKIISFGGKTIDPYDALQTAKMFMQRLPVKEDTLIIIENSAKAIEVNRRPPLEFGESLEEENGVSLRP